MPAMQRKMADIFALVQPQSPLRCRFSAGDPIEIHTHHDRLLSHGWITENDGDFVITRDGAAIMNHFRRCMNENRLSDELDRGAGIFVDSALDESQRGDWEIERITDSYVVVQNALGDRRRYQVPVEIHT